MGCVWPFFVFALVVLLCLAVHEIGLMIGLLLLLVGLAGLLFVSLFFLPARLVGFLLACPASGPLVLLAFGLVGSSLFVVSLAAGRHMLRMAGCLSKECK